MRESSMRAGHGGTSERDIERDLERDGRLAGRRRHENIVRGTRKSSGSDLFCKLSTKAPSLYRRVTFACGANPFRRTVFQQVVYRLHHVHIPHRIAPSVSNHFNFASLRFLLRTATDACRLCIIAYDGGSAADGETEKYYANRPPS